MAKRDNKTLNELLVTLFNSIMTTETKAVITEEFKDVSHNDMHIIEAIGIEEPRKMSEIAKRLGVTVGTLTTNMNSLERKNYVVRERGESDKRVVFVTLTERGRKAFFHHRDFHKKMIKSVVAEFTPDEQVILMRCLNKLNEFFVNG
ncbi:MAG: MarR family transcriptional regulator [Lachnospiraceae bacterium]|nr:MarR family transcriptional regulator [Lachnospiraceae bacterium]